MSDIARYSVNDHAASKAFFDENGFVLLSDAFNPDDLEDVRTEIAHVIQAHLLKAGLAMVNGDAAFTDGLMALEKKDHEYVAAIYDTIYQTPPFMRLISNRKIEAITKTLLGVGTDHALYGYTNRCLFAPPSDERRTYGWHQEVFYTVPHGSFIQNWAPLVSDTTAANGTIEVAVGSHKEGIAKQSWNDPPSRVTQIIVDEAVIAKYPQRKVEMRLGELLLFSGYLAHRSGVNITDQVRYSLVGMFHDVTHVPFVTPKLGFNYRKKSPRAFYDEVFVKETA